MRRLKTHARVAASLGLASALLFGCGDLKDVLQDLGRSDGKDPSKPPPPAPPSTPPGQPGDPSCAAAQEGSPSSCKDTGTWKDHAWASCQAAGLILGQYTPVEECGGGNYRYVQYTCCKPQPPAPPAPVCQSQLDGDGKVCKDVYSLKQSALLACQRLGLELTDYAPIEECGGGNHRYVRYTCCKPSPPPAPPPTSCQSGLDGDGQSCNDVYSLKQAARAICETAGLELTDYAPVEECGGGNYRYVRYTCCKVQAPPPPSSSCESALQGGPTSCKDVGTWKQYAHDACLAAGATLTDYTPVEGCGDGVYRYVRYTCCKAAAPGGGAPAPAKG